MHTAALEFFDHCQSEPDTDRVIARFMEAIGSYGFEVATAGAWVGVGAARAHRFYFNNWPQDWLDLYNERNFFRDDPMVLETHRRMTPFLWSELQGSRNFTSIGAEVTNAARDYGWAEVMGVPIHGPASYQGLVSLAARKPLRLGATDRALLRALSVAIHDRLHESAGKGDASQPEVQLTQREMECMRWVAAGKTDADIAAILGIATPTVHYHVERVKKKFRTGSRTEAVAYLVLAGTI
jgi:LuxR family quorum sensing-dependent transcriptional regulator